MRHPARAGGPRAAPVTVPVPVAERRLVSVLFADLVGFTPYAAERDAEEVRETLTRYFDLAGDVIGRYGGTVEKFIGDAVMAVWGAPVAHEDDAERAVRAALELLDAVRVLGPGTSGPGGGAHRRGRGHPGRDEPGDGRGRPRQHRVPAPVGGSGGDGAGGEATWRAASRAIAFEEAGEQVLRGKDAPVPAWRALRVVAGRGGRNRSDALEAPFVGRDEELRAAQGPVRRHRAGAPAPPGLGDRPRRDRQDTAGLGAREVPRRPGRGRPLARGTLPRLRGRDHLLGPGRDGPGQGRPRRGRGRGGDADEDRRDRPRPTWPIPPRPPGSSPPCSPCWGRERIGPDELFAAWRTFFERLAETAPGGAGVRGPPPRRTRACSTSSTT